MVQGKIEFAFHLISAFVILVFAPFSLIHSEDINFAVKSLSNYADSLEKATHKHNKKSLTEKWTPDIH